MSGPTLDPSCPSGSRFCGLLDNPVGCCKNKTHTNSISGYLDLEPAGLNTSYDILPQINDCPTGVHWWKCWNATAGSIMGCCKNISCFHGCQKGTSTLNPTVAAEIISAIHSGVPRLPSSSTGSSSTSVSGPTSTIVASTPALISGSKTTVAPTDQSVVQTPNPVPNSNNAAIAGGIAGGIVGLALLVALLAICYRRRTTRSQQHMNEGRSSRSGTGQARSLRCDDAELEEMKQGSPPTSPPLPPPSPSPSHVPSPLPPPPAYTAYRSHSSEPDRLSALSQPCASSPYPTHNILSPESPPPLENGHPQNTADRYSEEQSVSPISSHYQHRPFDDPRGPESSMYSEVTSSEMLRTHSMRS